MKKMKNELFLSLRSEIVFYIFSYQFYTSSIHIEVFSPCVILARIQLYISLYVLNRENRFSQKHLLNYILFILIICIHQYISIICSILLCLICPFYFIPFINLSLHKYYPAFSTKALLYFNTPLFLFLKIKLAIHMSFHINFRHAY